MQRLIAIRNKPEKLAIGLMSGTSVDGIDAALVKIKNHGLQTELQLLHFLTYPYPDGLQKVILENSTPGKGSVEQICSLNVLLGEIFAEAVQAILKKAKVKASKIGFIGSHGQTVHHLPEAQKQFGHSIKATLQLGEPAVIAKRTGILTVADFRPADMALGGQGAPLVPYFDFIMFRSPNTNRALLNIGGIANFTILKKSCQLKDVLAYDTGPGNMVIDYLTQELLFQRYDKNGKIALSGKISKNLLKFLLKHPYFEIPPPKSTGREKFGAEFYHRLLAEAKERHLEPRDIVATASELTVCTIWQSYNKYVAPKLKVDEFIVSGGGAKNRYLMRSLQQKMPDVSLRASDDYGIPSDAKEAICFAVLANETIAGHPNNVPSATGAKKATVLGKICL